MKKILAVVMAVMVLAGCVPSMSNTRATGDKVTLYSAKDVETVSECILFKWQNKTDVFGIPFGATIQPLPGGKTVYVDGNIFIADVTKEAEGGSKIQLYLINLRNGWVDLTKTCL